jgi:hypothetical protein
MWAFLAYLMVLYQLHKWHCWMRQVGDWWIEKAAVSSHGLFYGTVTQNLNLRKPGQPVSW